MYKKKFIILLGFFSVLLNATELKIDANGDGDIDIVLYSPLTGQGEPVLQIDIKTKTKNFKLMYYYSTTDAKIETCGSGCMMGIQVQGGNYGLDLKEYYVFDKNRKNWFLKKKIELIPKEIKKDKKIISIKREEKITLYDESLTMDYLAIPKHSLSEFEQVAKIMDISLRNSLSKEYIAYYLDKYPISKSKLVIYNNIAYYLEKAKVYEESAYLLEKILEKYPNRTVAYYNLGDAYWGLNKNVKAKKAYKTYIKLMKENDKEKKIPEKVLERAK